MTEISEKAFEFVITRYRKGALDTREAIRKFRKRTGTKPESGKRVKFVLPLAVSVAASAVLMVLLHMSRHDIVELYSSESVAEYLLPDSSTVVLAPGSRLKFDGGNKFASKREVETEGKVFFKVRRDEVHPFRVHTEKSFIQVLGTEFQIETGTEDKVSVSSGKVLFSASEDVNGVILTEGMSAVNGPGRVIPEISESAAYNSMTWATGVFVFENEPVAEVLKTLSSYFNVGLTTEENTGKEFQSKRITGEFKASDLDDIIEVLESVCGIEIKQK